MEILVRENRAAQKDHTHIHTISQDDFTHCFQIKPYLTSMSSAELYHWTSTSSKVQSNDLLPKTTITNLDYRDPPLDVLQYVIIPAVLKAQAIHGS